jgi:hypothetical protein
MTIFTIVSGSYGNCDHHPGYVLHLFEYDLDKGSSKNIQDIIVTPKERLYMGKSGK